MIIKRRVVQICTNQIDNNYHTQTWMIYTALCSDGTMWTKAQADESWYQLPEIPDRVPDEVDLEMEQEGLV